MHCRWPAANAAGRLTSGAPLAADPDAPALHCVDEVAGRWALDRVVAGAELLVRLGGSDDRVVTDARVAVIYHPPSRHDAAEILLMEGTHLTLDGRELVRADGRLSAAIEI